MMRLALYTFGIFRAPSDDPVNDGFHARNDPILAEVDRAPWLIARSGYADEPGPPEWGEQVWPRFYVEKGDGWSPATLSLWVSPEAAAAFTWSGLHAEALRHKGEWMEKPAWPPYVMWWTATRPDWRQAVARHEYLHDSGPSARAFDFATLFCAEGQRRKTDKAALRAWMDATAGGQRRW